MWKLIISDDQGQQTVVNLVRDEYKVGRAEGNPVRLTERNISRHHATLSRTVQGYRIEDPGSYNGLFVNGVRVIGRQDLAHHDLIQLGDYRIEVIDEALDTHEQNYRPFPSEDGVMPASGRLPHRLVVLVGPHQGSDFPLEGSRFLIGRGDECEFRVDHASVSRIHAEVRLLDSGVFEIIDKGSANGLRINGHERPRALLDGRDVIELGDVVLKYIPEGQVFRADPVEGRRIAVLSGAPPPPPEKPIRLNGPQIMAAAIGGAFLVGALTIFLLPSGDPEVHSNAVEVEAEPSVDKAAKLLSAGDVFGAHAVITKLPPEELAQDRHTVGEVERSWAAAMLSQSTSETDLDKRKELLDEVARSRLVPQKYRTRALEAMNQLDQDAVDLDEIDELEEGSNVASREDSATTEETDEAVPTAAPPVRQDGPTGDENYAP